jgi:hypothetical protein
MRLAAGNGSCLATLPPAKHLAGGVLLTQFGHPLIVLLVHLPGTQ